MLCLVSVVVYLFRDEDFTSGMRLKSLPPSLLRNIIHFLFASRVKLRLVSKEINRKTSLLPLGGWLQDF